MTRFPDDSSGVHHRAYRFALHVTRAMDDLPWQQVSARVLSYQLAKAATSVGANLHEANVAQTIPDFIAKCSNALKEAHETAYWLRLACDLHLLPEDATSALYEQATELISILTVILKRTCNPDVAPP